MRWEGKKFERSCNDVVQIVDIQKSNYGMSFYLNFGVYVKILGEQERPGLQDCHVVVRLEEIDKFQHKAEIEQALNCENDLSDEARTLLLLNYVELAINQFISVFSNFDAIVQSFRASTNPYILPRGKLALFMNGGDV